MQGRTQEWRFRLNAFKRSQVCFFVRQGTDDLRNKSRRSFRRIGPKVARIRKRKRPDTRTKKVCITNFNVHPTVQYPSHKHGFRLTASVTHDDVRTRMRSFRLEISEEKVDISVRMYLPRFPSTTNLFDLGDTPDYSSGYICLHNFELLPQRTRVRESVRVEQICE